MVFTKGQGRVKQRNPAENIKVDVRLSTIKPIYFNENLVWLAQQDGAMVSTMGDMPPRWNIYT